MKKILIVFLGIIFFCSCAILIHQVPLITGAIRSFNGVPKFTWENYSDKDMLVFETGIFNYPRDKVFLCAKSTLEDAGWEIIKTNKPDEERIITQTSGDMTMGTYISIVCRVEKMEDYKTRVTWSYYINDSDNHFKGQNMTDENKKQWNALLLANLRQIKMK